MALTLEEINLGCLEKAIELKEKIVKILNKSDLTERDKTVVLSKIIIELNIE